MSYLRPLVLLSSGLPSPFLPVFHRRTGGEGVPPGPASPVPIHHPSYLTSPGLQWYIHLSLVACFTAIIISPNVGLSYSSTFLNYMCNARRDRVSSGLSFKHNSSIISWLWTWFIKSNTHCFLLTQPSNSSRGCNHASVLMLSVLHTAVYIYKPDSGL